MAFLTAIQGALTNVDSTAKVKLGSRYVDKDGNEYIYCAGAASVAAGTVCALELSSDLPIVERLNETIGAKGVSICIALAAVSASTYYGWFQVVGTAEVSCLVSDAADAVQYCTTTAGSIDDQAGTTKIHGIRVVDTEPGSGTANLTAIINHPHTAI
jgi:hypothetical protein